MNIVSEGDLESIRAAVVGAHGVPVHCEIHGPGGYATLAADCDGDSDKAVRVAATLGQAIARAGIGTGNVTVCADNNVRCSIVGVAIAN